MFVRLLDRSFLPSRVALNVTLNLARMRISAMGGFDVAEIEIVGLPDAAFSLTDMLRCGVEIYDESGFVVWQGIVWTAQVPWGRRMIGRSLEKAANRVQVAYTTVSSDAVKTAWALDTRHVARYGTKELIDNQSDAGKTQAIQYRDAVLARRAIWPAPRTQSDSIGKAELICTGLFSTLDWIYYANALGRRCELVR